jgi:hypothetical protein
MCQAYYSTAGCLQIIDYFLGLWSNNKVRGMRAVKVVLFAKLVAGCAVIVTVKADGSTEHAITLLSPVRIVDDSGSQIRLIRDSGIGLLIGGAGVLGYFKTSEVRMDPGCRVVLIGNTDAQLRQFASLIHKEQGVCNETTPNGGPHESIP